MLRALLVGIPLLLMLCCSGGDPAAEMQTLPSLRRNDSPQRINAQTVPHGDPTSPQAKVDARRPVTASMTVNPTGVRAGYLMRLVVHIAIAPGWHIYALDQTTGLSEPTTVSLRLPAGFELASSRVSPEPTSMGTSDEQPSLVFQGTLSCEYSFRVAQDATVGTSTIRCVVGYQACNQFLCRPHEEVQLSAAVQVLP